MQRTSPVLVLLPPLQDVITWYVCVLQASLFLLPDGVLLSIFPSTANVPQQQHEQHYRKPSHIGFGRQYRFGPECLAAGVVSPVMARLRGMQSLINESEDASFLLQVSVGRCKCTGDVG
jgi:hypothetical protein